MLSPLPRAVLLCPDFRRHTDQEFGVRLLKAGGRLHFCREARAQHHDGTDIAGAMRIKYMEGVADVMLAGDAFGLVNGAVTLAGHTHGVEVRLGFGDEKRLDLVAHFDELGTRGSALVGAMLPNIAADPAFGISFPDGSFSLTGKGARLFGLDGTGLVAEGQWSRDRVSFSRLSAEDWGGIGFDATLAAGHMTIGELRIQGRTNSEVIISAHSCHPSLCNDNLSGMAVATLLAQRLARLPLRYSYRFLWMPGTIGAIAWLALNESVVPRIKHGLVLSCLGDPGKFSYKRSRRGDSEIDQAVENLLFHSGREYQIFDFSPYGYDERQFCSTGFNLPVGCFMRTPNGRYPEYHTSADNLDFVTRDSLSESLRHLLEVVFILENNSRYLNLNPKCEPQLGRRGLYEQVGGKTQPRREEAMLWILNLSDGEHSLLDIAQRSGMPFPDLFSAAELLEEHRLLKKLEQ